VGEYHLSRDATSSLLGSVLGVPVSPATVQDCCERASQALAGATAEIEALLPAARRAHLDETSWKVGGALRWLWVASTERVTAFAIHARRGRDQLREWFPGTFRGVVTSDRWRPYEVFGRRQLCWSHLERDLQAVVDAGRAGASAAAAALEGAAGMFAEWHRHRSGLSTRVELQRNTRAFRRDFRAFCARGSRQARDRKWRALGRDLLRQWDAVFTFLDEEGVEPTNNTAERALRSAVMGRRGSQGTRSEAGTTFVARVLTAVANCRRAGRGVLDFIAESLRAHRAGVPGPSLVPP
jgi:transposase